MNPIVPACPGANPVRNAIRILSCHVLLLALAPAAFAETHEPVKIIFDTDYTTDCDDPGALAVLHALADNGEVEILATGASTRHAKAPGAIDVVNTYYGRPDIPVSATKVGPTHGSLFVDYLYDNFPHDTPLSPEAIDSVKSYRQILAAQPDDSVFLVTVGYLTNVAELLKSPADEHSPLNGHDLIEAKVREWACMGGNFWTSSTDNVNFSRDAASASYAIANFPKKITFMPREVASVPSPLRAGEELNETPDTNPVKIAYHRYFGRTTNIDRHCADLATVLYAARGAHDYWDLETNGSMTNINPNGTFTWDPDGEQDHNHLVMKGGYGVYSNRLYVEGVLRDLLKKAPGTVTQPPPPPPEPTPVDGTIAWYRFEEPAGEENPGNPIRNYGDAGAVLNLTNTGGPNGRGGGGGGYGASGAGAFGSAFDVLASGDGTHHVGTTGSAQGGGLTTQASVPQSALQGTDGAFTYEALIRISGISVEQTILSRDGPDGQRGFLFRVHNGNLSLYHGAGSVTAGIPTTGDHAFVPGEWFHAAVTYSGEEGTAGNLRFYWTSPAVSPEEANFIGNATLAADLPESGNRLGVGTTTRNPFRFELAGLIDEVRISGIALAAGDFLLSGPPPGAYIDSSGDGIPDSWAIARGLNPAADNSPGDPDGNGIPHLMEFALDLPPYSEGLAGLPVVEPEEGHLQLTAIRNPDAAHLLFIPEVSDDLDVWHSGSEHVTVLVDTPALLVARDNLPLPQAARRFMRLKVGTAK